MGPAISNRWDAITVVPDTVWAPAVDAHGDLSAGADVAELTGLLDVPQTRWPHRMRVVVRRERPHPGVQLSLFEQAARWRC
jgi:hypothetical protein